MERNWLNNICLSVCLSISLSVGLSVCLSVPKKILNFSNFRILCKCRLLYLLVENPSPPLHFLFLPFFCMKLFEFSAEAVWIVVAAHFSFNPKLYNFKDKGSNENIDNASVNFRWGPKGRHAKSSLYLVFRPPRVDTPPHIFSPSQFYEFFKWLGGF